MFGSSFGMADAMKLLTPFLMPGGDKMKAVEGLVKQFATDENIKKYSGKIIEGAAVLQAQHGGNYFIKIASTLDHKDIWLGVSHHIVVDGTIANGTPVFEKYLSQITQADILNLISLITSYAGQQPNTTDTKRIG